MYRSQLERTATVIEQIEEKRRMLEAKAAELERAATTASSVAAMSEEEAQRHKKEKKALAEATAALTQSLQVGWKKVTVDNKCYFCF